MSTGILVRANQLLQSPKSLLASGADTSISVRCRAQPQGQALGHSHLQLKLDKAQVWLQILTMPLLAKRARQWPSQRQCLARKKNTDKTQRKANDATSNIQHAPKKHKPQRQTHVRRLHTGNVQSGASAQGCCQGGSWGHGNISGLLEGLYGQASTHVSFFKVLVNGVATAFKATPYTSSLSGPHRFYLSPDRRKPLSSETP